MEIKIFLSFLFVCLLIIIVLKKLYDFFNSIFVFINRINKLYDLFFVKGIKLDQLEKQLRDD